MKSQPQKAPYVIRRIVDLEQGEQIPVHRAFGPQTYQAVGKEIIKSGFHVPTGYQTAPLVHATYCSPAKDEEEFKNVRNLVRNRWFWVFNQNVYTPEGMYSIHDEKARGTSETFKVKALEKMLEGGKELTWGGIRFSKESHVGFAPVGSYTFGKHTGTSLAKQGNVVIQYGVRGAELLGEVTEAIGKPTYTYGVSVQQGDAPEVCVSALVEGVDGLLVGFGGDVGGFAFPVSAPQN